MDHGNALIENSIFKGRKIRRRRNAERQKKCDRAIGWACRAWLKSFNLMTSANRRAASSVDKFGNEERAKRRIQKNRTVAAWNPLDSIKARSSSRLRDNCRFSSPKREPMALIHDGACDIRFRMRVFHSNRIQNGARVELFCVSLVPRVDFNEIPRHEFERTN